MLIAMKGKNLKNDIEKNTLHSTLQHLIYVKITLQIIIYFKKNTTYMYDIYNFSKRYGLYFFFYCFLLHNFVLKKGKKKNYLFQF